MSRDVSIELERVGYSEEEMDYMWRVLYDENSKVRKLVECGRTWRDIERLENVVDEYHKKHEDKDLLKY